MYKTLRHLVLHYCVQLRENRLRKKYKKKKHQITKRLQKEKKLQLNKLLKANRTVAKL